MDATIMEALLDAASAQGNQALVERLSRVFLDRHPEYVEGAQRWLKRLVDVGRPQLALDLAPALGEKVRGDANVLLSLGEACLAAGRQDEATAYFDRVAAQGRGPQVPRSIALRCRRYGFHQEALTWGRRWRELAPGEIAAVGFETRSLARLGRTQEALDVWREFLSNHPSDRAAAARDLAGAGLVDEAITLLEEHSASGRLDSAAREVYGDLMARQGRGERAARVYVDLLKTPGPRVAQRDVVEAKLLGLSAEEDVARALLKEELASLKGERGRLGELAYARAVAHEAAGESRAAAARLREALAFGHEDPEQIGVRIGTAGGADDETRF